MEALLNQCLTSLILDSKELREKMDVIVVIDGATDRSSEIAHRYADQYPEMFSVIDKENGNYGSCVNAALPRVQGKYVRILDADDSYDKDNLHSYLNVLDEQDVDLVLTDFETVDIKGTVLITRKHAFPVQKIFSFREIPDDYFIEMHCVAYRSSIFRNIDYHQTEGISYTDMEWVFHPMSEVRNVYYFNKVIYRYLNGREGQTIDQNVLLSRIFHVEKGLWKQIEVFQQIPTDNITYGYLIGMLKFRIKFLYQTGMAKGSTFDLAAFDEQLHKVSPGLYKETETILMAGGLLNLQMPIIKMWRRMGRKKSQCLYPLYVLYFFMSKVRKIVHG